MRHIFESAVIYFRDDIWQTACFKFRVYFEGINGCVSNKANTFRFSSFTSGNGYENVFISQLKGFNYDLISTKEFLYCKQRLLTTAL